MSLVKRTRLRPARSKISWRLAAFSSRPSTSSKDAACEVFRSELSPLITSAAAAVRFVMLP